MNLFHLTVMISLCSINNWTCSRGFRLTAWATPRALAARPARPAVFPALLNLIAIPGGKMNLFHLTVMISLCSINNWTCSRGFRLTAWATPARRDRAAAVFPALLNLFHLTVMISLCSINNWTCARGFRLTAWATPRFGGATRRPAVFPALLNLIAIPGGKMNLFHLTVMISLCSINNWTCSRGYRLTAWATPRVWRRDRAARCFSCTTELNCDSRGENESVPFDGDDFTVLD